jgi:hypothetical protein
MEVRSMRELAKRLSLGAEILDALERKRRKRALTPEDIDREYIIVADELWDLEEEIIRNPGALARHVSG